MNRLSLPALLTCILLIAGSALATGDASIAFAPQEGTLALVADGKALPLWLDADADPAVQHAAGNFREDIERVTGVLPALETAATAPAPEVIIVGTLGHSPVIDAMVARKQLDVSDVCGRWEAFEIATVDDPAPGVRRALVVAGSDRRGTVYGLYTLSEQIGVSPWYWWADVPVPHRDAIHALPGRRVDAPAVQYRGIFLNDEAPALSGWASERFGGFNHQFYGHVFDLILRLRGNYLWPAMWGSAFADDDPQNAALAHARGVIIGTSHHEPMMRAHDEWRRYGTGPWDYVHNEAALRNFWRTGLERVKDYDKIITLGMRGDGDEAMSEDTNVALLERIVHDQRTIIQDVMGNLDAPQVWTLYKEVQGYYERGMRVPDDVILLWANDNWGNIRRLPTEAERHRPGGAGVYYHFDYVGGPRSYKWLNVTPITKVWEQMHMAWEYGARRLWIVNVGDLKPMEFPISFFLDYAWDPEAIAYEDLNAWSQTWAAQAFGEAHAAEVASLINGYTKLNRRRTPEMLAPGLLSVTDYREAERVLAEWQDLVTRAEALAAQLQPKHQSAFYQLVLYPVTASSTVQELYICATWNALYAKQRRTATNTMDERVRELFERDGELAAEYHRLNGGKWNHFMAQANIGYDMWQQPPLDTMPAVARVRPETGASPAIAIEGSPEAWPLTWGSPPAVLPPVDVFSQRSRWIDVFNRGARAFEFTATANVPWLHIEPSSGTVDEVSRIEVSADWSAVPLDAPAAEVVIQAPGFRQVVKVPVVNPAAFRPEAISGHVEVAGVVAIEAPHFTRAVAAAPLEWKVLEEFGNTVGAVALFPVTAPDTQPGGNSPRIDYDFVLLNGAAPKVEVYLAPTLNFQPGETLRFALSIDDGEPQVVEVGLGKTDRTWEEAVGGNVRKVSASFPELAPGQHTLRYWYITPGVVLQKLVIDVGGLRPSYLGP